MTIAGVNACKGTRDDSIRCVRCSSPVDYRETQSLRLKKVEVERYYHCATCGLTLFGEEAKRASLWGVDQHPPTPNVANGVFPAPILQGYMDGLPTRYTLGSKLSESYHRLLELSKKGIRITDKERDEFYKLYWVVKNRIEDHPEYIAEADDVVEVVVADIPPQSIYCQNEDCGKDFSGDTARVRLHAKYCSRKCGVLAYKKTLLVPVGDKKYKPGVIVHCGYCSMAITRNHYEYERSQTKIFYCNDEHKKLSKESGISKIECAVCRIPLIRKPSRIKENSTGLFYCAEHKLHRRGLQPPSNDR